MDVLGNLRSYPSNKRVQRGRIPHNKEDDGRVYVYLDPVLESRPSSGNVPQGHASRSRPSRPGQSPDSYVRSLEDRVGFLEEQVRRQTDIIAGLVQRVPELEAPQAPHEEPEGTDTPSTGAAPQEGADRRSWWRRFFFGE